MYETFFGFSEKPFSLTPDPKYLFLSTRHTEAFAHLAFGHQERGGFVVVTGEVGTGKTLLARAFLARLGPETATAVILYPALSAGELLRAILDDLHVKGGGDSLKDLVDSLHGFLLEARRAGRTVVLLIDEAQDLSPEVLEQVRLLSNLETDTEKLIQIVLVGQSELLDLLGRRELRQLAQRVTARYHLTPLDRAETVAYVQHRLAVAGGVAKVGFTPSALAAVHRASGGVPRLVNLICDRALLAGYARGTRSIDAATVRLAAREVRGEPPPRLSWEGAAALLAGVAVVGLALALSSPNASSARPPRVAEPAPAPARTASDDRLERLLAEVPGAASTEHALRALREAWGAGALERTTLRADTQLLRRLDLPAVLEMAHPARPDLCSLALLALDGERALVSVMGQRERVDWAEVDRRWTRQVVLAWRDVDGVAANPARAEPWLHERLLGLGYVREGRSLAESLTLFQREAGLVPDGRLGARTLMALYAKSETGRPRLRGAGSS